MIFSANKQRFTQMDVNPFRTEQRMFSLLGCDFEEYQVSLWPKEQTALHQFYLSLRECVCFRGLPESDTVSMDWVKALLLTGRVSSLEPGDDGAVTGFSWKTRE